MDRSNLKFSPQKFQECPACGHFVKDPYNCEMCESLKEMDSEEEMEMQGTCTTNDPKAEVGVRKVDFSDISPAALAELGEVLRKGSQKYGKFNWADYPMKASIYYNAMLRHIFAWWSGESLDQDDGFHHLAHVMACAQILIENELRGKLRDDRPVQLYDAPQRFGELIEARKEHE